MAKKWDGRIPHNSRTGDVLEYWDGYSTTETSWDPALPNGRREDKIDFKPNYVFEDELIYDGYDKGRSKMIIWLRSIKTGGKYPMLMGDYDELMLAGEFNGARIKSRFTFIKRGPNFRLVPADKVKKCKHCGHARKDHVNDSCLFDSSSYEIDVEIQKVS